MEVVRQLLGFAKDNEESKAKIKDVQAELETVSERMDQITYGFQRFSDALQHLSTNEAHERDKLYE